MLDRGAREDDKDEGTFEQRLKVAREKEGTGLGAEHFRKCEVQRQPQPQQQQVWPVKGTGTLEQTGGERSGVRSAVPHRTETISYHLEK